MHKYVSFSRHVNVTKTKEHFQLLIDQSKVQAFKVQCDQN